MGIEPENSAACAAIRQDNGFSADRSKTEIAYGLTFYERMYKLSAGLDKCLPGVGKLNNKVIQAVFLQAVRASAL